MNSSRMALLAVQLVARRNTVTVSELARELQVAPSTAHRVLANCRAEGFVRQDEVGGAYVPGGAMHELALSVTSAVGLRDAATTELAALCDSTAVTTSLLVLEGRLVRFVQSVEGANPRHATSRLGRVRPAHCTSGGKAILAFLEVEDLVRRYPGRRLERRTDASIGSWGDLSRELEVIRARGWAINMGESDRRITAIGAPILLGNGVPAAAVTLAADAGMLQTREEVLHLVDPLVHTATRIQVRLRGG